MLVLGTTLNAQQSTDRDANSADVIIYGGAVGGIFSAISVSHDEGTVIVLEPSEHIGEMVTRGLGWSDLGTWQSIGGMAAEFYRRMKIHYDNPVVWKFETRDAYRSHQSRSPH